MSIKLTRISPEEWPPGKWYTVAGVSQSTVYVMLVAGPGGRRETQGVAVVHERSPVTAAELGNLPLGAIGRAANRLGGDPYAAAAAEPLNRRRGEDNESFLNRVAQHYRLFASSTQAPAKAIAERSGVPVRRVHYWISEARKVGALPEGRRGKVG